MEYPSVFKRYIAALVDVLVVLGLLYAVARPIPLPFSDYAFWLILLYEPLFTSFLCTLGQLLMGFRVRTFDGRNKINLFQAVFRYIIKYVLGVISLISIPAQKHRRGIHDLLTKTIAINESASKKKHREQEHPEHLLNRRDEGTTIESPVVVENEEAETKWIYDNYWGFLPIDIEYVTREEFRGRKITLQHVKGETVTLYFKHEGDADLDIGTSIESPIVVEDIEAEYEWVRENRPGFAVVRRKLITEGYWGDEFVLQNRKGDTETLYFSLKGPDPAFAVAVGQSSPDPEARERPRSKIREELDEMRQAHRKGKSSSRDKVEPREGVTKEKLMRGLADGTKYVGEWKGGYPHGQGTWTYPDGGKYVGGFKDGKRHGQGTHTSSNGIKYVGEYKDNEMHGQGTLTSADGGKYVGGFKDGKRHGQGTLTSADGIKYVGEYKDNEMHGQGTYTWADGTRYVGKWKDGERWNGTISYLGQVVATYSEGESESPADSTSEDKVDKSAQGLNFSKAETQELIDKFGSSPPKFRYQRDAMRKLWHHFGDNKGKLMRGYAWLEAQGSVERKSGSHSLDALYYAEALYNDGKKKGWLRP